MSQARDQRAGSTRFKRSRAGSPNSTRQCEHRRTGPGAAVLGPSAVACPDDGLDRLPGRMGVDLARVRATPDWPEARMTAVREVTLEICGLPEIIPPSGPHPNVRPPEDPLPEGRGWYGQSALHP